MNEYENISDYVIEDNITTVRLVKKRITSGIMKMKEKYPDKVEILGPDKDGVEYARIPTSWISIEEPSGTD